MQQSKNIQDGPFTEIRRRQWDMAERELLLYDPTLSTMLLVFHAKQGCFLVISVNPEKASKRGLKEEWRLSWTEINLTKKGTQDQDIKRSFSNNVSAFIHSTMSSANSLQCQVVLT